MSFRILQEIVGELHAGAGQVQEEQAAAAVSMIQGAGHVFVAGAGRSGFAARGFANRLLHLGIAVSFVGEPTTPPIGKGDVLVIGSGSGMTASLVVMAQKAKKLGAGIVTLTLDAGQAIGQLADVAVVLPGNTRKLDAGLRSASVQPSGSLFEQLSWLVYDSMVMMLMARLGQERDDLLARHGNLE